MNGIRNDIRKIAVVCLLLCVAACGMADRVPEGVLPKEAMRDILVDMNLADAHSYDVSPMRGGPLPDSVRQVQVKEYYRQILDLHGVSVKKFMDSYHYYESHPDRLKEVYEMMLESIAQYRRIQEAEERKEQYAADPGRFFPYPENTVISKKQDTILPFLKRRR
ncbi:DUF4296 domain-containing protein [Chitinophaga japonensis]|uniref:Uncharacterized protein DUF4296 n=1 Tax=Chitinophaga japonensis TaxID=104662 RepID=A0A562TB11_CHIJA|nr:DUF4296 domain-containing protein [Chitinophaga japonensis]TWI90762.1 uncharacterized protein DUF4296 [Chitinophaga japonensis]